MSVFVKAILTIQRQVRELKGSVNRLFGRISVGVIGGEDTFVISEEVYQGNYMITENATIILPTPSVGKKFYFMLGVSGKVMIINLPEGTDATITGSYLEFYLNPTPKTFLYWPITGGLAFISPRLVGSYIEITGVSPTQWTATGIMYQDADPPE